MNGAGMSILSACGLLIVEVCTDAGLIPWGLGLMIVAILWLVFGRGISKLVGARNG